MCFAVRCWRQRKTTLAKFWWIPIDLQVILNDESGSVKQYLLGHLRNYNLQHLQTICLPGTNEQVRTIIPVVKLQADMSMKSVLCEAAVIPGSGMGEASERYVDPRYKKSFLFDHVTQVGFDGVSVASRC